MGEKEAEKEKKEAEKEKKGGGGGGEGEKKKDGGGEAKKEEAQSPVEVKLDMHCEGCAQKVRRSVLKGFKDAEKVAVDAANNKLKVVGGKVDPWKLKEFLENKTGKKVDFISPKDPPKKKPEDAGGDAKKAADAGGDAKADQKKKSDDDDKKPKAPSESTVVLKIRLHCDACIKRIQKEIYKFKGVKEVAVDAAKDLVTVKGTMDANSLAGSLKKRLSRSVEVVDPKAGKEAKGDGGGGDKKDKAGEKKDGAGGGEKKGADEEKPAAAAAVATPSVALPVPVEMNRMDYYGGYGYRIEMMHAPQLFSDENPNACSVM